MDENHNSHDNHPEAMVDCDVAQEGAAAMDGNSVGKKGNEVAKTKKTKMGQTTLSTWMNAQQGQEI